MPSLVPESRSLAAVPALIIGLLYAPRMETTIQTGSKPVRLAAAGLLLCGTDNCSLRAISPLDTFAGWLLTGT